MIGKSQNKKKAIWRRKSAGGSPRKRRRRRRGQLMEDDATLHFASLRLLCRLFVTSAAEQTFICQPFHHSHVCSCSPISICSDLEGSAQTAEKLDLFLRCMVLSNTTILEVEKNGKVSSGGCTMCFRSVLLQCVVASSCYSALLYCVVLLRCCIALLHCGVFHQKRQRRRSRASSSWLHCKAIAPSALCCRAELHGQGTGGSGQCVMGRKGAISVKSTSREVHRRGDVERAITYDFAMVITDVNCHLC